MEEVKTKMWKVAPGTFSLSQASSSSSETFFSNAKKKIEQERFCTWPRIESESFWGSADIAYCKQMVFGRRCKTINCWNPWCSGDSSLRADDN